MIIMAVSSTNLYSETWTTVRDLIEDNVTDPKTNLASSPRKWVYTNFPDLSTRGFTGFPLIIVNPVEITDGYLLLNDTQREDSPLVKVEVWDEFTNGMGGLDSLSNSMISTLRKASSITTLQTANLFYPKISSSNVVDTVVDNKRLLSRAFIVTMKTQTVLQ